MNLPDHLTSMPIETEEQRQALFDSLSDKQLEFCFVMAAARDDEKAAARLKQELDKRKRRPS